MRRMDAEPAAPRANELRAFYVVSSRASHGLARWARRRAARMMRTAPARHGPPSAAPQPLSAVLVVRPSSLGDIVHALSLVADIRKPPPGARDRLGCRGALQPLVALDPDVRRVIPVAFRRWRHHPLAADVARAGRFRRVLRASATTRSSTCRSRSRGPDRLRGARACARSRSRQHPRAGRDPRSDATIASTRAASDRPLPAAGRRGARLPREGPPRFGLAPPRARATRPRPAYVVLVHATSRADKLWPEATGAS